ncbi:MAG: ATP-binding cassette domain-containing protein [Microbacteriaceae bacterium]|jgi:peptide/nickel transport system ATP-binding protein|nr:ATP-binding cassette domain-containing protein [Microbacteriaceae bacterium]MCI1206882.1 ATP-binding cassette domain-containing protein [Microbacteriaceae bacterium]
MSEPDRQGSLSAAPTSADRQVLDVRGLRVAFAGREVVRGVSLQCAPGECLAIVGESGSGKSVTARALLGLLGRDARVQTTRLEIAGTVLTGARVADPRWHRLRGRRVGFVLQDALGSLDPLVSIGRQVAEPLRAAGVSAADARRRAIAALDRAGMPAPEVRARQRPGELSGGLRQRALIAAAIAAGPRLLIADEPTTALDASVQSRILTLLAELKQDGLALLLISHDLRAVARVADRIAVMEHGKIVEAGDASQLLSSPRHPYTRTLIGAIPTGTHPDTVSETAPVLLQGDGITVTFPLPGRRRLRAVSGVDIAVHAGEALGIVGESGSGKSTLLDVLLGLRRPEHGRVVLFGDPWSGISERQRRPVRRRLQSVGQDPQGSFDPRWTAEHILREAIALAGTAGAAQTPTSLLGAVGLPGELLRRHPAQFSGGQRQRLSIARALAFQPEVLLCDEPVSALDVTAQAEILRLLAELTTGRGIALVLVSHDLAVIRKSCDRVLVMHDGQVVERGPVDAVLVRPTHPYTQRLLAAEGMTPGLAAVSRGSERCIQSGREV